MENATQPSIKNRIKICADSALFDSPQRVKIRRNDDTELALVLKNGGKCADISDIAVISLEIFDIGARNSPSPRKTTLLFKTEISREDVIELNNEDGFNAILKIPAEKSTFDAGEKWMRICVYTNGGERTTVLQGWFDVEENFGDDTPAEIIEAKDVFLKADDAKIYYLAKSANLADLTNISLARKNLNVSSTSEINTQLAKYSPTTHSHSNYATNVQLETLTNSITENSQRITDVAKLVANKVDASVLHCNGGYAIANNVDYPEVFSVAFRTDWDFVDMSKKFTPLKLGMSGTYGLNFYSLSSDGRLRLYVYTASVSNVAIASYKYSDIATNLNTGLNAFVLAITKDADGNFFPKLYVNGNLIENLSTTKVPAFTMGSGEFKLNSYSASNITAGEVAYQDVYLFNFDISDVNAPYTIADYQIGKSIPPSLKRGYFSIPTTLANNSWTVVPDALSTATSTTATYDVDTKTFTWTATAQATTFFWWWLKHPIKAGSKIKVSFGNVTGTASPRSVRILYVDNTYDVSSQTSNPSIAPQMVSNTTIELSPTKDVQALTFDVYFSTAGDTLSVSDLKIEVVGATLALEDYTIGGKILDYSGNKNHATITDNIEGDYDTNIEAFVETITTLTSEQN